MVSDILDLFSLIAPQDGMRGDPPAMMAPACYPFFFSEREELGLEDPIEGENFAMDRATDSALKVFARRVCVVFGLLACVTNVGCAKMRSYNASTPLMLGAAAPFGRTKPASPSPGNDLYAQEVGRGVAHSRTLLAQDRARSKARQRLNQGPAGPADPSPLAETPPLQVALHPPEPSQSTDKGAETSDTLPLVGATDPATPATEPAGSPTLEPNPAPETSEIAPLIAAAQARLDSITSYQVLMKRQERVGETLGAAEEVLLSVRRDPKAIRLEWPDGPSKGREVLYSAADDPKLMHVKTNASLVPPMSLAVDNPMVLRNSRHPITEAGFETILSDLKKQVAQSGLPDSPAGKMSYGGLENPGQLEQPSHKIVRVTPTGENWAVYLDPTSKLPVMVEGLAANGELLERYLFGAVTIDPEVLAAADAFDPSQRWGQAPSGLLSRLAKVGSGSKAPDEVQAR